MKPAVWALRLLSGHCHRWRQRDAICDRVSVSEVSKTTALLLGCVATKRAGSAPAKDLYCSPLWRGRRGYAESTGRPWFILSALHGLVEPDQRLDSYNLALSQLSAADRRMWGEGVVARLAERVPLGAAVVEVHAGSAYRTAIDGPLCRHGARMSVPLANLGLGQQLAWYGAHRA
jgi:hypothetical protein